MNKQDFNMIVAKVLQGYGFEKYRNRYYKDYPAVLMVFSPYKSAYGDMYYLEYGFCIKEINEHLPYPLVGDAELEFRMGISLEHDSDALCYTVEYRQVDMKQFESAFEEGVAGVVMPEDCNDLAYVRDLVQKEMVNGLVPLKIKGFFGFHE